ncbi:PREDICTED: U3 small nucleolar RNA-associated protein 18 homolog [Acropora digitifera]|uniref:U3 small nucleolar RNA-associated protein 18 homolog n=1 Tax=Acropora digitifera TaxID=70779 RepID=UPI00077AE8A3|nr:PREDICTED: U3 small nucleolar RNA-associated protein 18 homolog [Acropora digitifera]
MMKNKRKSHLKRKNIVKSSSEVSRKRLTLVDSGDEAEKALERLVFGGESDVIEALKDNKTTEQEDFSSSDEDERDHFRLELNRHKRQRIVGRRPAWEDDDDELERIDISANPHLNDLRATEDETVVSGKKFSQKLRQRMVSAPASLQCIEFHPSAKVLLTAGFNKTLTLFQIDGKTNPKLQSIFLDKFPIRTAHFSADGEQVVLASRRRHFYVYDMMKGDITKIPGIKGRDEWFFDRFKISPDGKILVFLGKNGYLLLLSSMVSNYYLFFEVKQILFAAESRRVLPVLGDGEVYIWDMNSRRCIHKFRDEGCLTATTLAASRDGRYFACGSDSGVVNIYDDQCLRLTEPKPLKAIMNLTTSIDKTLFNSTSEILAISSREKRDSFKLIHLPSLTTFSNWPSSRTPLRYVHSFDFSPNSGYLSIGNDSGSALLFRLNHFVDS